MRRKRLVLGLVLVPLGVVAVLAAGGFIHHAITTAPVGTPTAVEFADADVSGNLTGATVLALGEATHGTAEFQQARLTLLTKVVDDGFTTVAFEEDAGSMTAVNAWVQGGEGTLTDAVNRFGFRLNKTTEMAEFLQWVRDYNADVAENGRIQLYGVDTARPLDDKTVALDWLAQVDPAQAAALATRLEWLNDDTEYETPPADVLAAAAELRDAVESAAAEDTSEAAARAALSADALVRGREWVASGMSGEGRDTNMSELLARVVQHRATQRGDHALLFAHNGHVDRAGQATGVPGETMGSLNAARWGGAYKAIGTDAQHADVRSDDTVVAVTVDSPLRGLFAGTSVGYLEIEGTSGENRAILDRSWPMLSAGSNFAALQAWIPMMHEVQVVPSQAWDGLIYVTAAGPTTPIG